MKILDVTFKRKVNCSASICLWNHWDQDHINYVHREFYTETEIFYEDETVLYGSTCFIPSSKFFERRKLLLQSLHLPSGLPPQC